MVKMIINKYSDRNIPNFRSASIGNHKILLGGSMSSVTKLRSSLTPEVMQLSRLDIDDLIIMSLMLEDSTYAEICYMLKLTPPAISHRLRKYLEVFGENFLVTWKTKKVLSETGKLFALKARQALCSFLDTTDDLLFKDVKL